MAIQYPHYIPGGVGANGDALGLPQTPSQTQGSGVYMPPAPPPRTDRDPYTSFGIGFGDEDNPTNVNVVNPGYVDLAAANPELYKILESRRKMAAEFGSMFGDMMDPAAFARRRGMAVTEAETGAMNRMSRMGLMGSSAGAGMVNDAAMNAGMAMDDKRLMDAIRGYQVESSMLGGMEGTISGIQGQYGDFQKLYLQTLLGAEGANAAADAADADMWGKIASGAGTVLGGIGGFLIGGPAGAYMGATIGGGLGKAGSGLAGLTDNSMGGLVSDSRSPLGFDPNQSYLDQPLPWQDSAAMYTYPSDYGF